MFETNNAVVFVTMFRRVLFVALLVDVILLTFASDVETYSYPKYGEDSSSLSDSDIGNPWECYSCESNEPVCGDNEVYDECINASCDPRNCTQVGFPVACPRLDPDYCIGCCVCETGYVRNDCGACIPKTECPSCGGDPNAVSSVCGRNCKDTCANMNKSVVPCTLICHINSCECKPNYVYDDNQMLCVLPSQCTPVCKEHEVYSDCINGGCTARNCSQLGFPVPCIKMDPAYCIKGCVCEEGYLRNSKGVCVPKKQCPSCGGDPNAVASQCGNNCKNTCANLNKKDVVCTALCKLNSCECKPNYVYDENQMKCVLPSQCTPTCKAHEVYSECTNSGCDAQNCSQLGYPVPCVRIDPAYCKKGCVCEYGYVRNSRGICIPRTECPSCGGDKNAVATDCGNNYCRNQCANLNKTNVICPLFCQLNGCECKQGYTYDPNLKQCVLPSQCTPTCNTNEVYSTCANGLCKFQNCTQYGQPIPFCPRFDPSKCKGGCICANNYLRDPNGVCIPQEQCPATICKDPEVYSACTNGECQARNCTQLGLPIPCVKIDPNNCKRGCVCKNGYLRSADGTCVPTKQCPPRCQVNEVYSNCSNGLCRFQFCTQYGQPLMYCPRFNVSNCVGGCICPNNYLRNADGICIPKDLCPEAHPNTTINGDCGTALQRLLDGNTAFTGNFLGVVIKKNRGKSVVMSPFSVLVPLGIMALYTDPGNSYNQITKVLNLKTKNEIRCAFTIITNTFQSRSGSELDLAAKIYVNKNKNLTENFKTDTQEVFGAEGESVDFGNPTNAADIINKWVEEKTRNRIKDLVSPSMFNKLTRVALINAIYFLGAWVKQFNSNSTYDGSFYPSQNETVSAKIMYCKGSFRYAEISLLDAKVLEIPYKGGNFTFFAALPNTIDGYEALAEKLRDPTTLKNARGQLSYTTCEVHLPRYHTATSIDLSDVLKQLNITDVFNESTSDLNGIIEGNEKLEVTAAVQKADIEVNEIGTEAAAANAIIVGTTAVLQSKVFKADHSFIYYIFFNENPLFVGVFTAK